MDAINDILNEIVRQQIEHRERTLAEIIKKYDFMVCSTELMNKVEEVLPEGTHITYTPYIGEPDAIYAIKKFNVMALLDEALKEKDAVKQESETVTDFADRCRECGARNGKLLNQEPKTGYWVNGDHCSECGCDVPAYIVDWKWEKDIKAKYCPNCGIKMVEKEEEK